jgi:hypothetical protein
MIMILMIMINEATVVVKVNAGLLGTASPSDPYGSGRRRRQPFDKVTVPDQKVSVASGTP